MRSSPSEHVYADELHQLDHGFPSSTPSVSCVPSVSERVVLPTPPSPPQLQPLLMPQTPTPSSSLDQHSILPQAAPQLISPSHNAIIALRHTSTSPISATTAPESVDKRVACDQCGSLFGDTNSLRRHAARAHRKSTSSLVVCQQCNITVKNEQNLKRHVAVCHTGVLSVACKTCAARFCSVASLRMHQQTVHQVRKRVTKTRSQKSFPCQACGDCFKWKGNLKRHMQLMHLGIRPWSCHVCQARFGTKSNMRVHLMTHSKEVTGGTGNVGVLARIKGGRATE